MPIREAAWATLDKGTDAYTSRFVGQDHEQGSLGDFLPFGPKGLLGEAPALPLAAPVLEVLKDDTSGDVRTLRLRASSPRGAEDLSLWLESDDPEEPGSPVLSAAVDGEPVEEPESPGWGRWALDYYALPGEGVELTLKVRAGTPVRLRVADRSDGLPDAPGVDETRPPGTMPESALPTSVHFAEATFVGRSFDLSESE